MRQFESIWPETSREDPHVYLDQEIHRAALQYDWDDMGIADLYDPEKGRPIHRAVTRHDEPLTRMVLLCRARSRDWESVLAQAVDQADREKFGQQRCHFIFSDTTAAQLTRDELYEDMAASLIDSYTLSPVDITAYQDAELAQRVADGHIQIEYDCPSASGRVFPEEL